MSDAPRSTILEPGQLYPDVPEDVYHTDPCERPSLSSSIAKILTQKKHSSPAHAYQAHPSLGASAKPANKAQEFGSALHSILLGGPEVVVLRAIYDKTGEVYSDYKTKFAREWRVNAERDGKIPLLEKEWKRIEDMLDAIVRQFDAFGIEHDGGTLIGDNEVTAVWEDPAHHSDAHPDAPPTLCRCRFDNLSEDRAMITELKTIESADPDTIEKQIHGFGYNTAAAAYIEAAETILPDMAGRVGFRFIFCESTAPFIVTPVELTGENLLVGRMRWAKAKGIWHECLNSDQWPGYTDSVLRIGPPTWALEELAREDAGFD